MKLSNDVTLSLSNEDMNALVADSLDRSVLFTQGRVVVVQDVEYGDAGKWEIIFSLEEEEEEKE